MTVLRFTLLRNLRNRLTLIISFLIPIVLVFVKPLWGEDGSGYTFLALIIMMTAFLMGRNLIIDRQNKTMLRVYAAPITMFRYLTQTLLAHGIVIFGQILFFALLGIFVLDWSLRISFLLLLCYTVFAASSIGFALAWHSLFKAKATSDAIFTIVVSFMSILGGIFIPIQLLPPVIRTFGMLFPTYWFSNSLAYIREGNDATQYILSIGVLLTFTIIYLLFGSKKRSE